MHSGVQLFLLLGGITILAHFIGKLTRKLSLPDIIGYLFVGIVFGIPGLKLLNPDNLKLLTFIPKITLAFIAFSIGAEFNLNSFRRHGRKTLTIIFFETTFSFLFVTTAVYLFTRDLSLSLIIGAIAPATAAAGTYAVIQECGARGKLARKLSSIVAYDDGIAIAIFAVAFALARTLLRNELLEQDFSIIMSLTPALKEVCFSMMLGGAFGYFFSLFVVKLKKDSEITIILFSAVLLVTGISIKFNLSIILTNMIVGFLLSNMHPESISRKVTSQASHFTPILFILFFIIIGANLEFSAPTLIATIGIIYFFSRILGKIIGASTGAIVAGAEGKIKKYLGFGILSQSGVALGLVLLAKYNVEYINTDHAKEIGAILISIIVTNSILFEIIGPILTKFALKMAGEIPKTKRSSYRIVTRKS